MYRLLQTDDLESAALLKHRLLEADPSEPSTLVIVQSAHMQRWLSRLLSRAKGIWFQPDFATPDAGLRKILSEMKPELGSTPRKTLFMDDLKYLSFRSLSTEASKPGFAENYPLLAQMLDPESSPHRSPEFSRQRLYELADSLSGLLFNYAQLVWSVEPGRPADTHLFTLWESGRTLLSTQARGHPNNSTERSLADHELWQQKLFGIMFPPDRNYEILGYQTYKAASEAWQYQGQYSRIVLYGSAFLSSQTFAFFNHLGQSGLDIEHILLTPSPSLALGAQPATEQINNWSALLKPFLDAAAISKIDLQSQFHQVTISESAVPSPLEILRRTLNGESGPIPQSPNPNGIWPHPGFRCFSCTTPLREVEALKHNLLDLMSSLRDSDHPLMPQDIAIMAPDIRRYRPYLEACFPAIASDGQFRGDHLAINLVDLDFGSDSAVISALEALLGLPDSRLERSFVLELLDNPAIRLAMRVEEDAISIFRSWTEAYEVRWGLNANHRQDLETGTSWSNTWDRALSRLFDDIAQGNQQVGAAELAAIGRIADYLHSAILTLRSWSHAQKSLADWVHDLQDFIDQSIVAPSDAESRILEQARSAAGNLLQIFEDLSDKAAVRDQLDWTGFRILFRDQLAHLSGSRGQHQIDGISCSSLRPYRAISFRLIALLGMNEGEIPRHDDIVSFDLAQLESRNRGLINNRLTDNYAWLETISSAREWLWVFYAGRDAQTAEKLEPATMVADSLVLLAGAGIPTTSLVVEERILAFDPDYFTVEGAAKGLKNNDPALLAAASQLTNSPGRKAVSPAKSPFFSAITAADQEFLQGNDGDGLHLTFKELVDFVCNPVRTHIQRRLGIYLDNTNIESDRDHEPLDPPPWLATNLTRHLASSLLTGNPDLPAMAQSTIVQEQAADRLYGGPFAERLTTSLEESLTIANQPLTEILAGSNEILTIEGIDLDSKFEVSINLSQFPTGPFKLRLSGQLRQLWQLGTGSAWVNISASRGGTASTIRPQKYFELAIARAVCRSIGLPVPQRLLSLSINPKTEADKILFDKAIPDLGENELDLGDLLQVWLINLVHPLPFYLDVTAKTVKPLTEALERNIEAIPDPATALRQAWINEWPLLKLDKDYSGQESYGPATNPLSCPYFRLLNGSVQVIPPWQDWYAKVLQSVWMPLWYRRASFVGKRSSAKKGKLP